MVPHYYVQLFQIGATSDPFHAIVVDSGRLLSSLDTLRLSWQEGQHLPPGTLAPGRCAGGHMT